MNYIDFSLHDIRVCHNSIVNFIFADLLLDSSFRVAASLVPAGSTCQVYGSSNAHNVIAMRTPSEATDSASSSTKITDLLYSPLHPFSEKKKLGSPLFLGRVFSAHPLVLEQKTFSERFLAISDPGSGAPKALRSTASNSS